MFDWFKPTKPPSKTQQVIDTIKRLLDTLDFNPYSSDKCLKTLLVYFTTITDYNKNINTYIDYTKNDVIIPRYLLPTNINQVALRAFFIDKDKFIDTSTALRSLLESMVLLLTWYDNALGKDNQSFATEKNILLLQPIVANIELLIGSFQNA